MTEKLNQTTAAITGLLSHATDAECIAACLKEIGKLTAYIRQVERLPDDAQFDILETTSTRMGERKYWLRRFM